jgi:3-deoxy-7-phosphoheptulonate synthase
LVTSWEVERLRVELAEASLGRAFLLQGGDCAETLADCTPQSITSKLKILLQMSLVLVWGLKKRVIRVGRFAGQYAKPRSEEVEEVEGQTLPVYRGDLINGPDPTPEARRADPQRLIRGYERAALTLNFIRALVDGGFADLHHPEYWDLNFLDRSPLGPVYRDMVREIGNSLHFIETLSGRPVANMNRVDFYTSHEGLHLAFEEALTRRVPHRPGWYNLGTHFPWIGMRTAHPEGAHVEHFRGIQNPVGVKVGPDMEARQLVRLVEILNPDKIPGKVALIHRLGVRKVESRLPVLIEAVAESGHPVLWVSDPMHGNTRRTPSGRKTRDFREILEELECSFAVHERCGTILGGVHFELTGEDVTECTGGARGLSETDLARAYRSQVDPRLNGEQALELAMAIANRFGSPSRTLRTSG